MSRIDLEGFIESVNDAEKTEIAPDAFSYQEILKLTVESLSLKNLSYAQNMEQRKVFADLIFTLVCVWLTFVLIIIIACGKENLKLSDTVLSILLGTTTANVCGFLLFVVKYLFNVENAVSDGSKKATKKKNREIKIDDYEQRFYRQL